MAVEFLVKARARKIFNKGAISQSIKQAPAIWGGKERLPDFLIFCIDDATKEDILPYTKFWFVDYVITDDGDSPSRIRCIAPDAQLLNTIVVYNFRVV